VFKGGSDGTFPTGGMLDVIGTLYGTTYGGGGTGCGGTGCGTVFSITPGGTEKALYAFKGGSDGANPTADLTSVKGTLYGTTPNGGGTGCNGNGCGTVFSITTSGTEKVVYAFKGGTDGTNPFSGPIAINGTLYGTTSNGGSTGCNGMGCGTVFSITATGRKKVLYRFKGGSDGANPDSDLIDVNGTLYGTTFNQGGTGCNGRGCGTVFSVTPSGTEKVVYAFKGGTDGAQPSGLIVVNGILYGTTAYGGTGCSGTGCGTVYSITLSGTENVVYRFKGGSDGAVPGASLINVSGKLYSTTFNGGAQNDGTVFSVGP
jgi:uncharacterized repeat protein (TIGR03803 family)